MIDWVKKTGRTAAILLLCLSSLHSGAFAAEGQKYDSLSYLYGGTTAVYQNNVSRTKGSLTTVCPDYFEIDAETGGLSILGKTDRTLIRAMQEQNIKVTPFLSNHWDRDLARLALQNREKLAAEIAAAVDLYGLDGVDIDIENINTDDREDFTDFIRLLRSSLADGKQLTVAVAANPWGIAAGWQGAYDYAALAKYADHIFIMAYDESYSGGPAGPVASYSFAERSVKYGIAQAGADKISLGVPFYGRYWKSGSESGGQSLTMSDIETLVSRYASKTWYDTENECARAEVTIADTDAAITVWGGKTLDAGTYDIWYENEQSLRKKLALVREHSLKGAGSWALGQEPEWLWSYYSGWLNGLAFNDIFGHWAVSHIENLYQAGIVNGVTATTFEPDRPITRAESLVMISRMINLPAGKTSDKFTDIGNHWAKDIIQSAAHYGIVQGNGDGRFRPEDWVSRQEFAVMLERVMNYSDAVDFGQSIYTDVSPALTPWSNNAIILLAVNNVLTPGSDAYGRFRPYDNITRAEVSKMINVARQGPTKPISETNAQTYIEPR